MDEMNAFERQLSSVVRGAAPPPIPVDVSTIVREATTTSPRWRFQSMFSALKFVVAGAIVALFGGFLLAGLLTQPSDDMAPAAVTASPSPTTTEELLSGMVTEEVEPGVVRVLSDGVRVVSPAGDQERHLLSIGADGSIWLLVVTGRWEEIDKTATLVRLGDPDPYPVDGFASYSTWGFVDLQVAPDGSPWALLGERVDIEDMYLGSADAGLMRLEQDGWVRVDGSSRGRADIALDGTIWQAVSTYPDIAGGRPVEIAQRWTGSGWETPPFDVDLAAALGVDPDVIAGYQVKGFKAAPDGSVWVGLAVPYRDPSPNEDGFGHLLLRFDGATWSVIDPMGIRSYFDMDHFDIGADGTAWVYLDTGPETDPHLARLSDGEWTVYSREDGVTPIGIRGEVQGYLEVAPDGTAWMHQMMDGPGLCRGVRSFDGTIWRRYLDGTCVVDLDIAPDGSVWVTGARDPGDNLWPAGDTYRIDPALPVAGAGSP